MDMEACIKAGTPGAEHERLNQFEGVWTARCSHWMDPAGDPMTSTGVMTNSWILDGRFLHQAYKSDCQKFFGTGYFGFNNITGQYEGLWLDSMSTAMMTDVGSCDDSGTTWVMTGASEMPGTGVTFTKRSVITVRDADHHTMEMFYAGPDGNEFRVMEIEYTRA